MNYNRTNESAGDCGTSWNVSTGVDVQAGGFGAGLDADEDFGNDTHSITGTVSYGFGTASLTATQPDFTWAGEPPTPTNYSPGSGLQSSSAEEGGEVEGYVSVGDTYTWSNSSCGCSS